jgi:hypothetical protein
VARGETQIVALLHRSRHGFAARLDLAQNGFESAGPAGHTSGYIARTLGAPMARLIIIVCFLIVIVAFVPWLVMAGFAPMLFAGGTSQLSALQKVGGTALIAVLMAVPVWVIYFGWRTIKGWRSGETRSAILMALPAVLILIAMGLITMSASTAP